MIVGLLLILVELPLLALVLGLVLPVNRRAGLTAGLALAVSLASAIGALVVEGGLIFWMVQQPTSGGLGSDAFMILGLGLMVAELVPPLFHALALGAMGWSVRHLVRISAGDAP